MNLIDGKAKQTATNLISVVFSQGLSSETFISQEAMILKNPCKNGLTSRPI